MQRFGIYFTNPQDPILLRIQRLERRERRLIKVVNGLWERVRIYGADSYRAREANRRLDITRRALYGAA